MLQAVGIDAHEVHCEVVGSVAAVEVVLGLPSAAEPARQAIGVRVIDAVRGAARTLGAVTVDDRFGDAGGH